MTVWILVNVFVVLGFVQTTKEPEAICNEYGYCSKVPNCYYKQLARKTQECKELRVAYNKAQDILGRVNNANEMKSYSLQESIKKCDCYREALDEIKDATKINCEEICGRKFEDCNDTSCFSVELLNIINKAKGTDNE